MPTQKEKLETLTGEKFPEPTEQEQKRQPLNGTPFWIIGSIQNGFNLIMGKYKLNKEPFSTPEQIFEWMESDQWNIILSMCICVVTDMINNQNKQ